MDEMNLMMAGNWMGIVSTILFISCFYFTLTFFQHLKMNNEHATKTAKWAAVGCLAIGLLVPVFYSFYVYSQMNI